MINGHDNERSPSSGNIDTRELDILARGGLIGLVGISISLLLNFIYQFILAKILGAAELGIFNLGLTISGLAGLVIGFGLDRSIVRFVASYVGKADREREVGVILSAFVILIFTTLLIPPLFWIGAETLARAIFHKPELVFVLRILIIGTPFVVFTRVVMGTLQGYKRIKPIVAIEQTLVPILRIVGFLVAMVVIGRLGAAAAYSFASASLIGFAISIAMVVRLYLHRKGSRNTIPVYNELIRFTWPLLIAALLNRTNNYTETLVVGIFSSSQEVGIYSICLKIAVTITIFVEAMSMIFTPFIAELSSKSHMDRLAFLLKTITRWAFILTLPIAMILFMKSYDLLAVIGQEFSRGGLILQILIISQLIYVVSEPAAMVLIMTWYNRLNLIDLALALLLSLVLDFTLIPKYGALGAAIAGTVTISFVNLLRLAQVYIFMHIHPFNWSYTKPLVAGGIAILAAVGFDRLIEGVASLWHLSILSLILLGVYVLSLICLRQNHEDREVLTLLFRRFSR